MERQTFIDLLFQSMRDSARQVRLLLGRPSSRATREQALRQVAMLQKAKEAAQTTGIWINKIKTKSGCFWEEGFKVIWLLKIILM